MFLTSRVLAAVCACCLSSANPSHSWQPDTLTVLINMDFHPSITSRIVKTLAKNEAAGIWDPYGVELLWSDGGVEAALHLDVTVARHANPVRDRSPLVLGRATIDPSGDARGPIVISLDTIASLLQPRNPAIHDQELGRALGRVLAHELGHVLLGMPVYHDRDGLMRPTFRGDELAQIDRWRFRLTDASVGRLRTQIAHLADAHVAENRTAGHVK